MRKISIQKKGVAVASSLAMVASSLAPMSAFATQPSVEYTGGNGDPITHLYLIADDSELANNNTEAWNKENAKVEVPVAIHYVAQADGTIVGPSDTNAQIRNFAGFPVNVSKIFVTSETNVEFVSTPEAADSADEIYLQMKPNSGTVLALADYTSSATESAAGENDGTGKRPTAGAEWNIAAAQSGVGTENAVASVLNLNALSGKIGGFNQLNPAVDTEIGQINWQIKPGTYANPAPALNATMFANNDIDGLKAAANYITGTGASDTAYINAAKALVGQTISVALNSGQGTMTARLVSVDNTRGLTFEAVDILKKEVMNGTATNAGGWAASALRTSMNSGDIYTTYFSSSALAGKVRQVTNTSYSNGGGTNSSSDYYWIPSANNIYGAGWPSSYDGSGNYDDGDEQFDYYVGKTAGNNATDDDLVKNYNSDANDWWLRSAYPRSGDRFMSVFSGGRLYSGNASYSRGVVPCFCL